MVLADPTPAERLGVRPDTAEAGRPIVLHVSEAFGGGIVSAIAALTAATSSEIDHHLLFRERQQHRIGLEFGRHVRSVRAVDGPLWRLCLALDAAIAELRPNIVHLHSTLAGLLGRVQGCRGVPIIYSPHCFAFENGQYGRLAARMFRLAENILSCRPCTYACIGRYEEQLAAQLWGRRPTYRIVNAVAPLDLGDARRDIGKRRRVVMVGRADAQKGVEMFAEVASLLRGEPLEFLWIGGANPRGEALLERHGVTVTGWIGRTEALEQLRAADLYLHTARWEGTPISVLEAASLGLPIVLRDIPHVADIPTRFRFRSAVEAVLLLRRSFEPSVHEAMVDASRVITRTFSPLELRRSVLACYRAVLQQVLTRPDPAVAIDRAA